MSLSSFRLYQIPVPSLPVLLACDWLRQLQGMPFHHTAPSNVYWQYYLRWWALTRSWNELTERYLGDKQVSRNFATHLESQNRVSLEFSYLLRNSYASVSVTNLSLEKFTCSLNGTLVDKVGIMTDMILRQQVRLILLRYPPQTFLIIGVRFITLIWNNTGFLFYFLISFSFKMLYNITLPWPLIYI